MVQIIPMNYNNEHYKPVNFMNGNEYQQHPTPPLPSMQQHQQQMPIPMPVPMLNHLILPHPPHTPPNFFHPPPPPPQPMYTNDQGNGQYMDYGNVGYHPPMGFMQQQQQQQQQGYYPDVSVYVPTLQKTFMINSAILQKSPVLAQRLRDEPQKDMLELDLYVLPETFSTIINHLFRPLTSHEIMFYATEKPQIAIELLEASEELDLPMLFDYLLKALKCNLTHQDTAMIYIEAMEPYQPLEGEENRNWLIELEDAVVKFMVEELSARMDAFTVKFSGDVTIGQVIACGYLPSRAPNLRGFADLARTYAALPQHLMIRCLEHAKLPVQDGIQRSYFASRVLAIFTDTNNHHQRQQQQVYGVSNDKKAISNNDLVAVMKFENGNDTIAIVKKAKLKKGRWDPKLYDQL